MAKTTKLSENPLIVTLSALLCKLNSEGLELNISKGNDKMGDIPYLSMPAGEDPIIRSDGIVLRDFTGTCKGCCNGCQHDCYALRTEYQYDYCRYNYAVNYVLAAYAPEEFEKQFCKYLKNANIRCFRLHESGEFFSWEYFEMICRIFSKFPRIQFYAYTKRYSWVRRAQDLGIIPENFKINISARRENSAALKKYLPEFTQFIWDCSNIAGNNSESVCCDHCPAVSFNGKKTGITCLECERCIYGNCDTAVYDHSGKQKHKKS